MGHGTMRPATRRAWGSRRDVPDEAALIAGALEPLKARLLVERFHDTLVEADAAIERGEAAPWSPDLPRRLKREGDGMVRLGEQPDPDVCP